jgi:hypothetical protein
MANANSDPGNKTKHVRFYAWHKLDDVIAALETAAETSKAEPARPRLALHLSGALIHNRTFNLVLRLLALGAIAELTLDGMGVRVSITVTRPRGRNADTQFPYLADDYGTRLAKAVNTSTTLTRLRLLNLPCLAHFIRDLDSAALVELELKHDAHCDLQSHRASLQRPSQLDLHVFHLLVTPRASRVHKFVLRSTGTSPPRHVVNWFEDELWSNNFVLVDCVIRHRGFSMGASTSGPGSGIASLNGVERVVVRNRELAQQTRDTALKILLLYPTIEERLRAQERTLASLYSLPPELLAVIEAYVVAGPKILSDAQLARVRAEGAARSKRRCEVEATGTDEASLLVELGCVTRECDSPAEREACLEWWNNRRG